VPASHIVGVKGEGYKIAISALNEGRVGIGAQMLGLAQGAWDAALPFIHQRKQFGQPVAHFQGMQFSFAQAKVQLEASRLLVYNAARQHDAGQKIELTAAIAKLHASQTAEHVSSKAVEWLGGVGYTKEYPVEKFWRDSKIGAIYEGTTNLMLSTIAKFVSRDYE
jgi:short/branched chain acyl-CoA dehydrogenase